MKLNYKNKQCIDELVHFIPDVIELITKADWLKDIGKIFELTTKGISFIHKCISTFDEENENRKTFVRVLQEKKVMKKGFRNVLNSV